VISSLPACYALHFLSGAVFTTDGPALMADPHYPLPGYPSMDAVDPLVRADPYNPLTNGMKVRYPTRTASNRQNSSAGK
jgi:hypothetical protein